MPPQIGCQLVYVIATKMDKISQVIAKDNGNKVDNSNTSTIITSRYVYPTPTQRNSLSSFAMAFFFFYQFQFQFQFKIQIQLFL